MNPAAVHMQGITKAFNQITVLDRVDFAVRQGEIHALLGENGAGKSTLMKILRGVYAPDAGEMKIQDKVVRFQSPNDARAHGIAMVFQEFSLIPTLTVAQNIFLTRERRNGIGLLDDRACERQAAALFQEMGVEIDPRILVSQLSTGYRQLTEIASALSQDARILILDEPTASLTQTETLALFILIRRLKEQGIGIIYISHRMEEIFQIADRITVLRDGRLIISDEVTNLTIQQVIEHILGRKAQAAWQWQPHAVDRGGEPLLEVKNLTCARGVQGVSFRLYRGEILGLAGLMGSGRTELVQALFGVNRITAGEVYVRGRKLRLQGPKDSMLAHMALVPEDRRLQGLILSHTVKDNFLLPLLKLGRLTQRNGLINNQAGNQLATTYLQRLKVRANAMEQPVRLLSGGNQQKVVIGKWLSTEPEILLLDEPTVGVDIGTKSEIMEIVRRLADAGKSVIFISSELQELLAVSDRILILKQGQISHELDRAMIESEEILHQIIQGAVANGCADNTYEYKA